MLVSCLKNQKKKERKKERKAKTQQKNKRTQEFPLPGALSNLGLKITNRSSAKIRSLSKKGERGWAASHVVEVSDSHNV